MSTVVSFKHSGVCLVSRCTDTVSVCVTDVATSEICHFLSNTFNSPENPGEHLTACKTAWLCSILLPAGFWISSSLSKRKGFSDSSHTHIVLWRLCPVQMASSPLYIIQACLHGVSGCSHRCQDYLAHSQKQWRDCGHVCSHQQNMFFFVVVFCSFFFLKSALKFFFFFIVIFVYVWFCWFHFCSLYPLYFSCLV